MAYDTRCTGERKWVGVILRNLPADASMTGIHKKFESASNKEGDLCLSNYSICRVE